MPTLSQKLQLKEPCSMLLLNAPAHLQSAYEQDGCTITAQNSTNAQHMYDVVQLFATTKKELDALAPQAVSALKAGGKLWIAYPKKTSGIKSDLTRDYGWATVKELDYEAVRQIAVDDTWSSLRFKHNTERKEATKMGVDYPGIDRITKTVTIPADLQEALKQAGVLAVFEELAFTHRKEYVISVLEAKRPETRQNRIAKVVEKLQAA